MPRHIFDSGVVRVGPAGSTPLNSTNQIGENQSIDCEFKYDNKDLYDSGIVNLFAVDSADSKGVVTVKISNADFNPILMQYCCGATSATAGGYQTLTIGPLSKPQYCRLEFDAQDSAGKLYHFVATQAKAPGLTLGLKKDDFAMPELEFSCYSDPANGGAPATLSFQQ